jgi:hypothetical protein
MEGSLFKKALLAFVLWPLVITAAVLGASPNDSVIKAKQEAEAKGYILPTSRARSSPTRKRKANCGH